MASAPSTPTKERLVETTAENRRPLAQLCREAVESVEGAIPLINASRISRLEEAVVLCVNRHIRDKHLTCGKAPCASRPDCCAAYALACVMGTILARVTFFRTWASVSVDQISPAFRAEVWAVLQEEGFTGSLENISW
jgi:hypothetical protein